MSVKLNALVVDDSSVMRKMVMNSLAEAKLAEFQFTEAEDGQAALEKLKASSFDIAFVDWNMPNMTGVEMIRAVREHERVNDANAVVLVMITSEKSMAKMQEAMDQAGADHFISKPFTTEELAVKLKKVVEKAQASRLQGANPDAPKRNRSWF
jgi:two-component system, chemotaxis family, chemotaxis protein CheY